MSKQCPKCKRLLPRDEFGINRGRKDGLMFICRACKNTYDREYRRSKHGKTLNKGYQEKYRRSTKGRKSTRKYARSEKNKIAQKAHCLKRNFNLTQKEYNSILDSQDCVCAICRKPETICQGGKVRSLAVDHNHDTGKIRGLLCYRCNISLGGFSGVTILLAAAIYLEENN